MCPANLLWGWGLIWFRPTKERIPILLQFLRKCKVWVTPLHASQLTKRKQHFTRTKNEYCIKLSKQSSRREQSREPINNWEGKPS
jgi:hypothetical protein